MINQRKNSTPTYKSQNFLGKIVVENGERRILFAYLPLYKHFLNEVCKVGDEVSVSITNKRPKRSEAQNRFYWLYLGLIALSCGHSAEELHTWVKGKFLSKGITEIFGHKVRKVGSTTDLNRNEFAELLARIELETDVPLPDPEPFNIGLTWAEYRKLKEEQVRKYKQYRNKIN